MNLIVAPGNPLRGSVSLAGDKSLSHRALILSAMAEGESQIENILVAGVTEAMMGALSALGVNWILQGTSVKIIAKGIHGLEPHHEPIDCGNSATTLRLLAGALAASGIPAVLDGNSGLRRRPMRRIIEPLTLMGVPISGSVNFTAPLVLGRRDQRSPLSSIDYAQSVASAQVKSCLLLAALDACGPTILHEPARSRDHTERMLRCMGVQIEEHQKQSDLGSRIVILYPPEAGRLAPLQVSLPGDISSAAFLIVGALITPGSEIRLSRLGLNETRTGLLDALLEMGADIQIENAGQQGFEPVGDITVRSSQLTGMRVSGDLVVRMIDEFPAFAVAACAAQGETIVSDAGELRHKESDRISALATELRKLNAHLEERKDGFRIQGGAPLSGGLVDSHQDHRLAMALAIAGLNARTPVTVQGAEIIHESFPAFVQVLLSLGAQPVEQVI